VAVSRRKIPLSANLLHRPLPGRCSRDRDRDKLNYEDGDEAIDQYNEEPRNWYSIVMFSSRVILVVLRLLHVVLQQMYSAVSEVVEVNVSLYS